MNNQVTFHYPELIAAVVFVLGVIGTLVAKHKGVITFGKPLERRECSKLVCKEHTQIILETSRMGEDIADTRSEMMKVCSNMKEIHSKLDNLLFYHAINNGKDLRGKAE